MPDFRPVFHIMGLLACGVAAMMCVSALTDLMYDNPDWQRFLVSAISAGVLGIAAVVATRDKGPIELDLKQAFLVTIAGWLTVSLVGAIPFLWLGVGLTDAVFESVSGITTTGSSILSNLDRLPPGMLLWRALLQWLGGIGIIATAIMILPLLRVGGMQLFKIESSDTSEKAASNALKIAVGLLAVYTALTFLCFSLFNIFGMSGFDAVTHAMATLSTGGFSTHDASFGYFKDLRLHWTATVFMVSGAMPFYLYIKATHGNLRALINDQQVRGFVVFITAASILLALWLTLQQNIGFGEALTLTAFNIVSIITTTGFASTDYTAWGSGAVGFFLVLTFVGGCSGSTSGAIKIYRFQIVYLVVRAHIKRLFSPHRVIVLKYNGKRLPADVPHSILAFLTVFMAIIALFTVCLSFMGLDILTAYSASVTAITNVGPGLGEIIGPVGNFEPLPAAAKWLLSAAMLAGRLEVITFLIILDREFWQK